MAKSTSSYKYQSFTTIGPLALSSSFQDFATGAADDSDVVDITIVNTSSSSRTLTVAFRPVSTDETIAVVTIPAYSGTAVGNNAIRLITGNYIPMLYFNSNGNLVFNLKSGEKIRLKQDTGTDLTAHGKQLNY